MSLSLLQVSRKAAPIRKEGRRSVIWRAISALGKSLNAISSSTTAGGWRILEAFQGAWQRNVEYTKQDILQSPIPYACVTLIANDFGKLRQRLVAQDAATGIWTEVNDVQSPFRAVIRRPNSYQNHIQFKQWWAISKLLWGNTYALKERDARGVVRALYILDPSRVLPLVSDTGQIFYQIGSDNLAGVQIIPGSGSQVVLVPSSEIIHDRMNCLYHPLVGISPLYAAAITAGVAIEIASNTAKFYANNSMPGGILIAPGALDPSNAEELKADWNSGFTGDNVGKVAVLGDGMKFMPLSRNPVDSQMIETLRWSDERICSVFHVPGYKVGVGDTPNYNNIASLAQEYYATCLQSLIEEYETVMDEGLGLDAPIAGRQLGVDLDLEGLMRMDPKSAIEVAGLGIDKGLMKTNEARRRVNLPPVDGGEEIWRQQQYFPLSALASEAHVASLAPAPPPPPPVSPAPPPDNAGGAAAAPSADASAKAFIAALERYSAVIEGSETQ